MKKVLAVLLLLVFTTTVGIAESSIDLKSLSTEELTALKEEIEVELNSRLGEIGSWTDSGMGQYLPSFADVVGWKPKSSPFFYSNDRGFTDQFQSVSQEDFDLYCKVLEEWGFTNNKTVSAHEFRATNDQGMEVHAWLIVDQLSISMH